MSNTFINLIFSFFTVFILIKTISYGMYEIKNEKNLLGGICVISFCLASVVFSNIMFWIN